MKNISIGKEMAMKKIYTIFAAFSLMAAYSCTKEIDDVQTDGKNHDEALVYSQELVEKTFTADAGTRTALDGTGVSWVEGDAVEIYWGPESGDHTTATVSVSGEKISFSAKVGIQGPYYAVYPASVEAKFEKTASSEGTEPALNGEGAEPLLNITIPNSQSGLFKDAAIVTSYTTSDELNFGVFKSAVSLIEFEIATPDVTKVQFAPYSCCNSVGTVTVNTQKEITPAASADDLGFISLEGLNGAGKYYVAVIPEAAIGGVGLRVGGASGWMGVAARKSDDLKAERNNILRLGAIDDKISTGDWYITPEGAGRKDGSSWENAGDRAMFFSLMAFDNNKMTKQAFSAWRTDGRTIRLGTGEYNNFIGTAGARRSIYTDLLDEKPAIMIKGGYDPATGEISATEETVFDAVRTAGATGFFKFNTGCFRKITIEGITFKNAVCANQGGALYFGCPAELTGCKFDNCSSSDAGGALYFANGEHEITDCIFTNNAATSTTNELTGGAVYVGGSASVHLQGCDFTANSTNVTGGGALAVYSTALTTVANCSFVGNNPGKIGNGGAILQKKAGNILYVVNCSFDGNQCKTNGPDIFSSAGTSVMLYNCTAVNQQNGSVKDLGSVRFNVPAFVANSTILTESPGSNNGAVAVGNNGCTFINNIILSENGISFGTGSSSTTKRTPVTKGYNVYNSVSQYITWSGTEDGTASDKSGMKISDIFTSTALTDGVMEWNGELEGFTKASAAEVEAAIKSFAKGGTDFYNWLVENNLFAIDARGASRAETGWWPGAYQR